MALEYVDVNGSFTIPGAYPDVKVAPANSGLATTGVLMLVGEADAGPDYTEEDEIASNSFAPDQDAEVVAKYKGGPLVEAFKIATAASADEEIVAGPSRIILVKTNKSTKASAILSKIGGGAYATLQDLSYGKLGNLISYEVTKTDESAPTTGSVTFIPPTANADFEIRVNGGAAVTGQLAADVLPSAAVAVFDGLAGVDATGGAERGTFGGATPNMSITIDADPKSAVFALSTGAFAVSPVVGDTIVISGTSAVKGATNKNVGGWVVTAILTAGSVRAYKLSGTNPEAVGATAVGAVDFRVFAPIVIKAASAAVITGAGKSLEIAEKTTAAGRISDCFFALGTAKVAWVSKDGAAKVIAAAGEHKVTLTVARQLDGVEREVTAGGEVALKIGYKGATGEVVVSDGKITSLDFDLSLADFPTISDLATYINAQAGWTCAPGTAVLGNLSPVLLDNGTYACATTHGAQTGRVKIDAYRFHSAVASTGLVELAAVPAAGLPDVTGGVLFLAGGSKGGTADADITGAIDALEKARGNFLVPLFARDAAEDMADGLTESASSYTIDNVIDYSKAHVHKMSQVKRRRNRQAFLSKRGTFVAVAEAAANVASHRCAMTFEDFKFATARGIVQYQPWMGAVAAAAMQAGAFYKSLVHKFIATSGVVQAAGDWSPNSDGDVEEALKAGLLPAVKYEQGGFMWVSDQTTYGKDGNSVFNSIQMVYAADIVALTTAQRMERAFVGKSLADVSAPVALSYLDGIMEDFRRLKLIAPSDDAPLGYKNAKIVIEGPAMRVSVEVKIAGSIYFIPITFYVTEIKQTAAQK